MSKSNVVLALSTSKAGLILGFGGWSCHFRSSPEPRTGVRVKTIPRLLWVSANQQLKQNAPRVAIFLLIQQILQFVCGEALP